jgi:hypothetical protein
MRIIQVSVTQEHIDQGSTHSCASCPVALALRDTGPENSYLVNYASLHNIYNERVATLPGAAIRFITEFDAGYDVQPFTFFVQIDR